MKIAPSMLASDYTKMGEGVHAVQDADWLHLDIMDPWPCEGLQCPCRPPGSDSGSQDDGTG